jgi:hypothetical protein
MPKRNWKEVKWKVKLNVERMPEALDGPCKAKALSNGRWRNHGGLSTGPKTPKGRGKIAQATSQRMATGQQKRALEGFYAWIEYGGKFMLSSLAKTQERIERWRYAE